MVVASRMVVANVRMGCQDGMGKQATTREPHAKKGRKRTGEKCWYALIQFAAMLCEDEVGWVVCDGGEVVERSEIVC